MYKIYSDDHLLYDDQIENLKVFAPKLNLELNKTGSFSFTIYTSHPYYSTIQKLKSIVSVYQDDFLIFRGRVLNIEEGFYNQLNVDCEGELAFLLDSIQRPYEFTGSIEEYLTQLIENHNSQSQEQFEVGNVTVTDPNNYITRSNIEYVNTWDELNNKLINSLGGYISVRHADGVKYIDYLEDFNLLAPQKVEFAKNLLDLKMIKKGEDIATALIPLGAKIKDAEGNDTDQRLTIAEVNNGLDYIIDEDAVARYGFICKTQVWEDVTLASNLLTKGNMALASMSEVNDTIELSAADMATANKDIGSFHIGTYVKVTSNPHGIDQLLLITKLSIDLFNPAANKLTLGGVVESFTSHTNKVLGNVQPGKDGKDGVDAVTLRIESSRGTVFKNNAVSTILSVAIYAGSERITDMATLKNKLGITAYLQWYWQRMGEETYSSILASDSRISNDGFSFSLSPDDVDTKVNFMCRLFID